MMPEEPLTQTITRILPTDEIGSSPTPSSFDELRAWIDGATDDQLQQWIRLEEQVLQLQALVPSLPLTEDEEQQMQHALARALHHLDYRRPYTITVVGVSGAGKSTLINALLGRRLVKFQYGRPTTGTVVTVSQMRQTNGLPPYEQAIIRYHTRASLTEAVVVQGTRLGLAVVYHHNDPTQGLNLTEMLELVRDRKVQEVGPILCPNCKEENRPGARVCGFCGTTLPLPSPRATVGETENLTALEDLLETAILQEARLGTEETLILGDARHEQKVLDLMDEESPINKDRDQRLIPLIQGIEYQVRMSEHLPHVNLTDVPGIAARATLHEKRLREQLDPFKTDAILLVMPPDRPELLTNQLVPLVKEVLMAGLDTEQRRIAAGRIFLIVSKGDVVHGMSEQEAEQETRENVEKVAREITTDFFHRYASNVFLSIKALPALTAQLILSEPQQGSTWLREEKDHPMFRDISRKHYRDCVSRAQNEMPRRVAADEQAVLQWSRIPELQQTLKHLLGRNRWQQALYEASALYNNAYAIATDRINAEWVDLTGKPFGPNADHDLANLTADQSVRFGEKLQAEAARIVERFDRACEDLKKQNNRDRLKSQVQHMVEGVQRKIQAALRKPEFRDSFAETIEDPIYGDLYTMQGVPGPLVALQARVFQWFDEDVHRVTDTMMTAFQQELDREGVEPLLQHFCYSDFYVERYLTPYQEDIIGRIRADYEGACRGAVLYQLLHRKVANEVMEQHTGFGQVMTQEGVYPPSAVPTASATSVASSVLSAPSASSSSSPAATDASKANESSTIEMLIESVLRHYQAAHHELIETLPRMLSYLFFYHLTIARDDIRLMVKNLGTRLAQDVRDPKCPLYQQLQEAESGMTGGAEHLVGIWKQLGDLRLRLHRRAIPRSRRSSSSGSNGSRR
ncbi:MAG: hypothetical protein HC884_02640 [Chloroflexaceae bacterium]|nr:hypothetical protein [Chloroflexaceae bacterium]